MDQNFYSEILVLNTYIRLLREEFQDLPMRRVQLPFNIPKLLSILLVLCITATLSVHAAANSSEWAVTNETKVRLISGLNSIDDSQEIRLGIQFQMKPGWKIYWRSPGDAGFPPKVEWVGSHNLDRTNIFWPVPLRFSVQGLETLGYKNEIVLPVNAKSKVKNKALHIRAQVNYVTCNDICIPYEAKLDLKLPNGKVEPTKHLHLIETFRAKVPGNGLKYGLKLDALHSVQNQGFPPRLQLIASAKAGFSEPDVFIEGAPGLAFTKPSVTILDDGRRTLIDIGVEGLNSLDDRSGQTLDNRTFKITLVDGKKAIEAELIARAAPSKSLDNSTSNSEPGPSLAIIIIFAIIGGLILNLMPCVLPVLSLKVLSLIQYGGGEPREVRISFLSSAAGIFVAFLILAATLSSLKMGGMAIGWGIQFQQPWFLIALALLITIFACNFWGFFEIQLPQSISDIGVKVTNRDDFSRHFLQGAFATLLATPCSAPFVGTAVGFAGEVSAIVKQ